MKIVNKLGCILLTVLLCFTLSGCWDYTGLDEISIVSGIAIDKNFDEEKYMMTFEIVDLSNASKQSPIKTEMVQSEGKNIYDAIRNAKSRLGNKLYFGNTSIIVISNQIARTEGIQSIIDVFLRDPEPRETLKVLISLEETAKDILLSKPINSNIVSKEIMEIISEDNKVTAKTKSIELYKIYNVLKGQGTQLVLPAFHNIINDEKPTAEANGAAVFKNGKLSGYLTPEETHFYLFVTDEIKDGLLTFMLKNDYISVEIIRSKTKLSYSYNENKLKVIIDINTTVFIDESHGDTKRLNEDEVQQIEKAVENYLKQGISNVIQKVKKEFNSDIFGFGTMVYQKDPKLWSKINEEPNKYFKDLEIEIKPTIINANTGYLKK